MKLVNTYIGKDWETGEDYTVWLDYGEHTCGIMLTVDDYLDAGFSSVKTDPYMETITYDIGQQLLEMYP